MLGTTVLTRAKDDPGIILQRDGDHLVATNGGTIRCRHLVDAGDAARRWRGS